MLEILKANLLKEIHQIFKQIQIHNKDSINSKYIIFLHFYIINY